MKYLTKYYLIIPLLSLFSLQACKDVIFIPTQGNIKGFVEDNNGVPLAGVQVVATFEPPSQNGEAFPKTTTAITDAEGYYKLTELWDDVALSISQSGFRSFTKLVDLGEDDDLELDLTLEGSPSILAVTPTKTTLSAATPDTLGIGIEVLDLFNSQEGVYTGNILLQNTSGITQVIVPANMIASSEQQFLLEAQITSDLLPIGSYMLVIEVSDPDRNTYQRKTGQEIIVQ